HLNPYSSSVLAAIFSSLSHTHRQVCSQNTQNRTGHTHTQNTYSFTQTEDFSGWGMCSHLTHTSLICGGPVCVCVCVCGALCVCAGPCVCVCCWVCGGGWLDRQ